MNKESKTQNMLISAAFLILIIPNFLHARYSLYQRYGRFWVACAAFMRRPQISARFFEASWRTEARSQTYQDDFFRETDIQQTFIVQNANSNVLEQQLQEFSLRHAITELTIEHTHITRNALLIIMRLSSLEELNLVNVTFEDLDAQAVAEILTAFSLTHCRRFSIRNTHLNDNYVQVLYEILKLCCTSLSSLIMSNVRLRDQNLALLLAVNFEHLAVLDLSSNELSDSSMDLLANSRWVQVNNLEILDIQDNAHISREGIALLERESRIGYIKNTVAKKARRE